MPTTQEIRDNARLERARTLAQSANDGENPNAQQILLARIVVAIEQLENRVEHSLDQMR